ncbi:MAG: pentapeptide repeat-containing protein [Microvirga sp.]
MHLIDITGQRFERWTVVERAAPVMTAAGGVGKVIAGLAHRAMTRRSLTKVLVAVLLCASPPELGAQVQGCPHQSRWTPTPEELTKFKTAPAEDRPNFCRADLTYAHLSGADLPRVNLTYANLRGADLSNANLPDANLTHANLTGTDLSNANLTGTDLSRANLTGTDLSRANLSDANLSDADLTGVNLTGANLSRADLTGADVVPPPEWELFKNDKGRMLARPKAGREPR